MSDPEKPHVSTRRDYWHQLAAQLGADVPPEPETELVDESAELLAPASETGGDAESAVVPEPLPKRVPPSRPASDWRGLCEQLGLPAPPLPPQEAALEPGELPCADATGPDAPGTADTTELPCASEPVPESELGELDLAELDLAEFDLAEFDLAEFDEYPSETIDQDAQDAVAEAELEEADAVEDNDEVSTPREPAVRRRRRRGRRRSETTEPIAETAPPVDDDDWDAQDSTVADETLDSLPAEGDAGENEEPETRGRRPRRRRRRGSRREAADANTADSGVGESAEAGSTTAPEEGLDGESDYGFDDADDDDDERGGSSAHSRHRKIPTWEETIGVIVSANLQTRSRGDRDNGKGRARGSRRRGRGNNDRSH